jgi:hypothetical protein
MRFSLQCIRMQSDQAPSTRFYIRTFYILHTYYVVIFIIVVSLRAPLQAYVAIAEPGDSAAGLLARRRRPGPLVRRRREPQEQVAAGPRTHPDVPLRDRRRGADGVGQRHQEVLHQQQGSLHHGGRQDAVVGVVE